MKEYIPTAGNTHQAHEAARAKKLNVLEVYRSHYIANLGQEKYDEMVAAVKHPDWKPKVEEI